MKMLCNTKSSIGDLEEIVKMGGKRLLDIKEESIEKKLKLIRLRK